MVGYDLSALVGTEIVEHETVTKEIMGKAVRHVKWTVIEAYPHFVKCMRITEGGAEVYTTFNTGTLVAMGAIGQKGGCKYVG